MLKGSCHHAGDARYRFQDDSAMSVPLREENICKKTQQLRERERQSILDANRRVMLFERRRCLHINSNYPIAAIFVRTVTAPAIFA